MATTHQYQNIMAILTTLKQLKQDGQATFDHTDSYGIRYVVKIFYPLLVINAFVYSKDGSLLFFNNKGFDLFGVAKRAFEKACGKAKDESTYSKMHVHFASQVPVNYIDVKKAVEDWAVNHDRPFGLGDCQIIASKWENRNLAFDHAYTAACALENDVFLKRKCKNFRVDFNYK